MNQSRFSAVALVIKNSGRITAEDVMRLRECVYGGPSVTKAQLDTLFELNQSCSDKASAWTEFFAEAAAVYLVEQEKPYGYVDENNAGWLISHITRDGRIEAATELEVLIKVIEKSKKSPERMVRCALLAVKDTVLNGAGPARDGGNYRPGVVTEADVKLLRRILFAYGGDQHIMVSRAEGDVLFDINDATTEAENDPAWSDLFTKAIANCVLGYSGYVVPTRQQALRRERWLDEPASVSVFFSRMVGGLSDVFSVYSFPGNRTSQHTSVGVGAKINEARYVTEDEANWLVSRIGRDGKLHENERALLAFLRERSVHIHPLLQPVLQKALTA